MRQHLQIVSDKPIYCSLADKRGCKADHPAITDDDDYLFFYSHGNAVVVHFGCIDLQDAQVLITRLRDRLM